MRPRGPSLTSKSVKKILRSYHYHSLAEKYNIPFTFISGSILNELLKKIRSWITSRKLRGNCRTRLLIGRIVFLAREKTIRLSDWSRVINEQNLLNCIFHKINLGMYMIKPGTLFIHLLCMKN